MFTSYRSRFLILTLFGLSNFTNAVLWICFSPVVDATMQRYNVSNTAVNQLSLIFMFLYLPGSALGLWWMERYGLRKALITGAVLNLLCGWVRYASSFVDDPHAAVAVLMLGQTLGALAQPIFTNLPSRIGGDWFPSKEVPLSTVVAALSNPLGNAAGSVIPSIIVNGPGDIPALLLYQAIWCAVIGVAVVLLVKDRPPTPPSAAAALKWKAQGIAVPDLHHHHHHQQQQHSAAATPGGATATGTSTPSPLAAPLLVGGGETPLAAAGGAPATASAMTVATSINGSHTPAAAPPSGGGGGGEGAGAASAALVRLQHDFGVLLRNPNFLLLMTAFGIGLGIFNALLTLLAQIIQPCGYGSDTAGYAGGALLGSGLLGAVVMGVALELTRAYVPLLRLGIIGAVGTTIFFLASLRINGEAQLIAACGVMGAALIPLLPVSLENAAECTYPVRMLLPVILSGHDCTWQQPHCIQHTATTTPLLLLLFTPSLGCCRCRRTTPRRCCC